MSNQPIDTSIYAAVSEAIQSEAKRILSEGQVAAIVGYAAALAVWKALGHQPSSEIVEKTESIVFSSWRRPHDEIPTFA